MTDLPTSPSPKPKEPGSNKRIMTTQATPNPRPQPLITLEASGQDGILGYQNPNSNHNPEFLETSLKNKKPFFAVVFTTLE